MAAWLPTRPWYEGPATAKIEFVASCRFDDPAGAVGIETILVECGDGTLYQAPLTYRDAPLAGGDAWLVGTTDHSVLGKRWVYDACGDPVYAAALATAILTGTGQADEQFEVDGRMERREPTLAVAGTGTLERADVPAIDVISRVVDDDPTLIVTDSVDLRVLRRIDPDGGRPGEPATGGVPTGAALTGVWHGIPAAAPLAFATTR